MDLESALLLLNNIISPDSAQESQDKSRPVLTHVEEAFSFSSTSYLYCTGILSTQTTLPCKTNKLLLNHTHNGWSLTNNEFFDVFCTLRSVLTLEVTLFFSGGFGLGLIWGLWFRLSRLSGLRLWHLRGLWIRWHGGENQNLDLKICERNILVIYFVVVIVIKSCFSHTVSFWMWRTWS